MKRRHTHTSKDPATQIDLHTTNNVGISLGNDISSSSQTQFRGRKNNYPYHRFMSIVILIILSSSLLIILAQRLDLTTRVVHKELEPWPTPIIHIINTRFMQHQGNLTTLATARLHLFKTVCLPSMLKQKNQDFLWIIKVDPALDVNIRNKLIEIIDEEVKVYHINNPNRNADVLGGHDSNTTMTERIFVIGSNVNYLTGHEVGAWRGGIESGEVLSHDSVPNLGSKLHSTSNIFTGAVELLYRAKENEPYRIVLETRLDADDGLNEHFVDHVQKDAIRKFGSSSSFLNSSVGSTLDSANVVSTREYMFFYWCAESHIKWYLDTDGEYGQLDGEKRSNFCITPGLTIGFNIGTDVKDVQQYGHHELYKKLGNSCKGINLEVSATDDAPCIGFVNDFIAAVRSRTHTSAGMSDVQMRRGREDRTQLWNLLGQHFGVTTANAMESNKYFKENRKQIAKENLEGQCRGDHSCKHNSKLQLKQIINS